MCSILAALCTQSLKLVGYVRLSRHAFMYRSGRNVQSRSHRRTHAPHSLNTIQITVDPSQLCPGLTPAATQKRIPQVMQTRQDLRKARPSCPLPPPPSPPPALATRVVSHSVSLSFATSSMSRLMSTPSHTCPWSSSASPLKPLPQPTSRMKQDFPGCGAVNEGRWREE